MGFIRTLVHRPALVSVIYLIVFIFGIFSFSKLPIDMLPDMDTPVLTVVTAYPGASALDVEDKITLPIEESLGSVANLDTLSSVSRENVSQVILKYTNDADINEATNDVRQNLEQLKYVLPSDAETPFVFKFDIAQMPIALFTITVEGEDVRYFSEELDEHLVEPLKKIPGVGSVNLLNAPEKTVQVDVYRDRLSAHGLTLTELHQLIAASNLSIPAGDLEIGDMSFALRMPAEVGSIDELRLLPLMQSPIGDGIVLLRDVADVRIDISQSNETVLVNGEMAMMGNIQKTSDANTVVVTEAAEQIFREAEQALPGLKVSILEAGANYIKGTISNLQQTVLLGVCFVAIIVFAFLRRFGPTLIVTLAIPTSLIVTFMVIYSLGYTLNSVTLIALSLSVGLVVDNGVVALENISRKIDEGSDRLEAAYQGASEVGGALVASTTTTLVIFAPMFFVKGIIGQMFTQLAVVMIVTISASLLVALSMTPTLAARLVKPSGKIDQENVFDVDKMQKTWWEDSYLRMLKSSLKWPIFTIISSLGIGVLTLVLLSLLGTDFLPKDDVGFLGYTVELPVGTPMEQTLAVGQLYADKLRQQPEAEVVAIRVGNSGGTEAQNVARISSKLISPKYRERSVHEIGEHVMEEVGDIPEVLNLEMSIEGGGAGMLGAAKPITVEVLGNDLDDLQNAALQIQQGVSAISGTRNTAADLLQTKPELRVEIDRYKTIQLGVLPALIGQELRLGMSGNTISRYTADSKPRDVVLRLRPEDRSKSSDWKQIPIRTQSGRLITLAQVSTETEGESPIQILRKNKSRMLEVSTEISGRALGDVAADTEAMLSKIDLPEGVSTQVGGAIRDQRESFGDLGLLMALGLTLVYLVMVAQFESWFDPFIIMFSVPFAATGAFLALLLTGTNLSVTSFLGLIILIGVVVNNAIVLIDYIKLLRSKGFGLIEAVQIGGVRRLRPVIITTLTTSGGMLPLALTKGEGEMLWAPMGKTALGGLMVSSVVTLVLVPTMYVLLVRLLARLRGQKVPDFRDEHGTSTQLESVDQETPQSPELEQETAS